MKNERLTQWVNDGASLILDNPKNTEEAREQLQDKFKLACIKLAILEDKIERGELVERSESYVLFSERKELVEAIAEWCEDYDIPAVIINVITYLAGERLLDATSVREFLKERRTRHEAN